MNPFDANERHRYIIESGGNPVSSADGKEKEIWVNSINIIIGQTKCALFTNEMCKKKIFFHAKLKAFNQCLNSV